MALSNSSSSTASFTSNLKSEERVKNKCKKLLAGKVAADLDAIRAILPMVDVGQLPLNEVKQLVRDLLSTGQSVEEVTSSLKIPLGFIYRWRLSPSSPTNMSNDHRRLYDDNFKKEAIRQIETGVSVKQISQTLGVTQVTLHKWKKRYLNKAYAHATNELQERELEAPSGQAADYLLKRIQELEAERNALKSALILLLRSTPM